MDTNHCVFLNVSPYKHVGTQFDGVNIEKYQPNEIDDDQRSHAEQTET